MSEVRKENIKEMLDYIHSLPYFMLIGMMDERLAKLKRSPNDKQVMDDMKYISWAFTMKLDIMEHGYEAVFNKANLVTAGYDFMKPGDH